MTGTWRIAYEGLCKTGLPHAPPPPPPKVAGVGFLPSSRGRARPPLRLLSRGRAARGRRGGPSPPLPAPSTGAAASGPSAPAGNRLSPGGAPPQGSGTGRRRGSATTVVPPHAAAPSRRYLLSLGEVEPETAPGTELLPLAEVEAHLGAGVSRHQRRAIPRQGVLLGAGGRHGSGGRGAKERSRPPAAGDKGRAAAPPRRRAERPAPGAEDGGAPWREEAAPGARGARWRREERCRKPRALNA